MFLRGTGSYMLFVKDQNRVLSLICQIDRVAINPHLHCSLLSVFNTFYLLQQFYQLEGNILDHKGGPLLELYVEVGHNRGPGVRRKQLLRVR
jgi:hypothetical protein